MKILQRHHSDHRHGRLVRGVCWSQGGKATEGYLDIRTSNPLSEQRELKCSRMCQPELVRSLPINIPSLPNKGRSVRALIENHRQQRERVLIKLKRVEIRAVMDWAVITVPGLTLLFQIYYWQWPVCTELTRSSVTARPGLEQGGETQNFHLGYEQLLARRF